MYRQGKFFRNFIITFWLMLEEAEKISSFNLNTLNINDVD